MSKAPRLCKALCVGSCAHGSVHLLLLDSDGICFAKAVLPAETVPALVDDLKEHHILALTRQDCAGHA